MEDKFTPEELHNINFASDVSMFVLHEWSETAYQKAESIVSFLEEKLPEAKVHFIGSLALKLPGTNDVDINVHCSKEEMSQKSEIISTKFGQPARIEPSIVQWTFTQDGTSVDIILYNDDFEGAKQQIKNHNTLRGSEEMRDKYIKLKRDSDGGSEREYVRKKILYFKGLPHS